ncbi:MAG: hypothetical protein U5L09_10000 [Bacteroidales bacterium]|nr:hypothetical protein [Bacteroidales bacterium]
MSAFIGARWKKVYQFALEHGFRFLSYGDSCYLFKRRIKFLPAMSRFPDS